MNWLSTLEDGALKNLDPTAIIINLVLVVLLGQILGWHYMRYSQVLSNKRKFASILMFLTATTMMVITVVKTSLALSLGLVGALSIIRFRTPVKEPEDLAYLFLSIATGIGLGADQHLGTVMMCLGILLALRLTRGKSAKLSRPRVFAHITAQLAPDTPNAEEGLKQLMAGARSASVQVDMRRVDVVDGMLNTTMVLDLNRAEEAGSLLTRIHEVFPSASVTIVEDTGFD